MTRIGIKTKKGQQYALLSTSNPRVFCRPEASNPFQDLRHPMKQRFTKMQDLQKGKSLELQKQMERTGVRSPPHLWGIQDICVFEASQSILQQRALCSRALQENCRPAATCACTCRYLCMCTYILTSFSLKSQLSSVTKLSQLLQVFLVLCALKEGYNLKELQLLLHK